MIEWLVQTQAAHPALAQGTFPAGMLSPAEQAHYEGLKTEKRRRDWLLGRWTAKQLAAHLLQSEYGHSFPLATIEVENEPGGAPRLRLPLPGFSWELSLSHSRGQAVGAVVRRPGIRLGVDMEYVEPRAKHFIKDYFTAGEQAAVCQCATALRDHWVTAIWSAKEATLKATRLGLSVDTRCVECWLQPTGTLSQEWTPLVALFQGEQRLNGWWRSAGNFVITMVVQDETRHGRI